MTISKREFIAKMQISYKEVLESIFWIRLLRETNFKNESEYEKMKEMAEEITKIMYSILKTSKLNT
jgi:four helix bundle protein